MNDKTEFAKMISENSIQLVGFADTKASIIAGADGVILTLLFTSELRLSRLEGLTPLFIPAILLILTIGLLAASAIAALFSIRPWYEREGKASCWYRLERDS